MISLIKKIKVPFVIVFFLILGVFVDSVLPLKAQIVFYTISVAIKDIILQLIPLIIFSLIFSSVISLASHALSFILLLLPLILASILLAAYYCYFTSLFVIKNISLSNLSKSIVDSDIYVLFNMPCIVNISNYYILIASFACGLLFVYFNISVGKKISNILSKVVDFILSKLFVPCIPFFVFGFIVKISHDNILSTLLHDYRAVVLKLFCIICFYNIVFLFAVNNFIFKKVSRFIINLIPALTTSMTTMSSMASMPFMIKAAEKNSQNQVVARATIPFAINTHMLGDAIDVPFIFFIVLISFGGSMPDLHRYSIFIFHYMTTRFSVVGIPGGGIIVLFGVLESIFGFSAEMLSVFTAFYLMWEPLNTFFNVLGNSIFSSFVAKIYNKFYNESE